jgi:hypothetical protein
LHKSIKTLKIEKSAKDRNEYRVEFNFFARFLSWFEKKAVQHFSLFSHFA